MQTFFGLHRRNLGLFGVCLFGGALSGFIPTTASAADQGISTDKPTVAKVAPAPAQERADPPPNAPRWTFSVEGIALSRAGGPNQALVGQMPGSSSFFPDTYGQSGVEAFNSNQFWQGLAAGAKVDVTYRGDAGLGFGLSYFGVGRLNAAKFVGPDGDWLLMTAPGTFWQTQDYPDQSMAWKDTTGLSSAEIDLRVALSPRLTLLGGARWIQLNDKLVGWLTPADQYQPTWKQHCPGDTLSQVNQPCEGAPILPGGDNPPFWVTSVSNNLFGAQVGVEATLLEVGRLSLDAQIKAGVYDNNAKQTTVPTMGKQPYPAEAATNAAAVAGEANLELKYQLSDRIALKVGYEALWLDGVALAPGQIRKTYTTSPTPTSPSTPISASALGVDHSSNALFQGVTLGVACSF
jgi:hypothetical protein